MARNRKRAKERRDRRPETVARRSQLTSARSNAGEALPGPLEHAAPDAELADAQLALGRIEALQADPDAEPPPELSGGSGGGGAARIGTGFDGDDGAGPPGGGPGEVALPGPGGVPEAPARPRNRLLAFLEGSWKELQRVQWPDRRQVIQATAVVLGFVVVAGVYLGVADTAASHLMSYILTGK